MTIHMVSLFSFIVIIYGQPPPRGLCRLCVMQKQAIKPIRSLPMRNHTADIYQDYKVLNIASLYKIHDATFAYKLLHENTCMTCTGFLIDTKMSLADSLTILQISAAVPHD